MKPDDASIPEEDFRTVVKHAAKALNGSGAMGRFPTPTADILAFSRVTVSYEHQSLDGLFARLKRSAAEAVRRALKKVWGLLDVVGRIAYIDHGVLPVRQNFLKLHETAHAVLPHQNRMYSFVEDCEHTISPEISEHFDREANVFATEVLFQLGTFMEEANAFPFGINVPLKLGKKYGASAYAAIRRYVSQNARVCAVIVLDSPTHDATGFRRFQVRRIVASPTFSAVMGPRAWPDTVSDVSEFGTMLPSPGRRMSRPRTCSLVDANGDAREFVGEAFDTTFHTFLLLHATETLSRVAIIRP